MKAFRKLTLALAAIGLLGAVGWSATAHADEKTVTKAATANADTPAKDAAADAAPIK
jgi:hypothetical protein